MTNPSDAAGELFTIVVNHEEQYSIWRAGGDVPPGWTRLGDPASRDACLAEIDRIWTDIRPLSARTSDPSHTGDARGTSS